MSNYIINYIDGGDCCAECCNRVEALAADGAIVTAAQRAEIDASVGLCEHKCRPHESHTYTKTA